MRNTLQYKVQFGKQDLFDLLACRPGIGLNSLVHEQTALAGK